MMPIKTIFDARTVVAGKAWGEALVSNMALSFWGGLDPRSGRVTDIRHDLYDRSVAGKILFLPGSKGSSSSASVLLESIRVGSAPQAIVSIAAEPILATGSIIGRLLYGKTVPVVVLEEADFYRIRTGDLVLVRARRDGTAAVEAGCPEA